MHDPSSGLHKGDKQYSRFLLAMFGAGFATYAQIFGTQGLLPYIASSEGISAADSSMALSMASLGMALGILPWTLVADRLGRARAMTLALAISSILGLIAPFITPYAGFLTLRFFTGAALAAVPAVAMAYVSETISPVWIGAAAGTFVAGNTIGGVTGRVFAGVVASATNWRFALACVAVLAILSAVVFVLILPKRPESAHVSAQTESFFKRVFFQFRDPVMLAFFTQGFLLMGAFGAMYNYLSFRLADAPFSVSSLLLSFIFVVYLAGTVSARYSGWVVGRLGVLGALQASVVTLFIGTLLTLSENLVLVIVGLVLFTAGCFVAQPTSSSQSAHQAITGRAQASGLFQLSWLAGTTLFGWLGGIIYQNWGWTSLVVMFSIMFLGAAIASFVGLTWGRRHRPTI